MKISAGIVVIQNNQILLGHPTGSQWFGTYSIPKGEVEPNETTLEAALRETEEEMGIKINIDDVVEDGIIEYKDEFGIKYKEVHWFLAYPINKVVVNHNNLQKEEIDWAGFMSKEEAEKRIFGRFKPLLKYLK
jgi:8-oxo-dGTP pyrophosphatase MutT (NUDIX family)